MLFCVIVNRLFNQLFPLFSLVYSSDVLTFIELCFLFLHGSLVSYTKYMYQPVRRIQIVPTVSVLGILIVAGVCWRTGTDEQAGGRVDSICLQILHIAFLLNHTNRLCYM